MKESTKDYLRSLYKGKPRDPETVEKMKKGMKGRIPWNKGKKGMSKAWNRNSCILISPTGEEFEYPSQAAACREHGLPENKMSEVKNKKLKSYHGRRMRNNPKR